MDDDSAARIVAGRPYHSKDELNTKGIVSPEEVPEDSGQDFNQLQVIHIQSINGYAQFMRTHGLFIFLYEWQSRLFGGFHLQRVIERLK